MELEMILWVSFRNFDFLISLKTRSFSKMHKNAQKVDRTDFHIFRRISFVATPIGTGFAQRSARRHRCQRRYGDFEMQHSRRTETDRDMVNFYSVDFCEIFSTIVTVPENSENSAEFLKFL